MKEQDDILIEKYLTGTLSDAEQLDFEARKNNPDFQNELMFQEDLKLAMKSKERSELRQLLADQQGPNPNQVIPLRPKRSKWWLAAASTLLVFGTLLSWWILRDDETHLFAEFYQSYPNIVSPITKGNEATSEPDGYQFYELGQLPEAIAALEELQSDTAKFYLALAHLAKNDDRMAEKLLLETEENKLGYFQIPSKWYLALIDIKRGEMADAPARLQEIIDADHPLSVQALKLSKEL